VTNTWEPDRDVLDAKENKVGAVTVSKLDYGVNTIGQRTALSQTGTAFASVRGIAWAYDSYGQVTSADSTLATQDRAYQYDAIGNRKKSANSLTLPVSDNYIANSLNQYSSLSIPNPQSPISNPIYDLDGNATSYPLPAAPTVNSTLTYDSENRLTSTTVNGITTTQQFDATGRRISKTTGSTTRLYLYEGWNVIAEYSRSVGVSPTLQKTYLWGTDLSRTLQGAGGVGGLLLITDHSALLTSHYPTYDGNGNISEYLTATGAIAAHFEYDPFGNTVINTDATNQFTYKFSTKPQDVESGLCYYGYRYYDAVTARWISRDPIEEKGGINVYSMVENNSICVIDVLGKKEIPRSSVPPGNRGPGKYQPLPIQKLPLPGLPKSNDGKQLGEPGIPDHLDDTDDLGNIPEIVDDPINGSYHVFKVRFAHLVGRSACDRLFASSGIKKGCGCCSYTVKQWSMLIGGIDPIEEAGMIGAHMRKIPNSQCVAPPPLPPGAATISPTPGFGQINVTYEDVYIQY
jgi:RHS repeat-associated protein